MIEKYSFGHIVVGGKIYSDIKIKDGKAAPWRYTEHHRVTEQDILDIIEDAKILVIGTGAQKCVSVDANVYDLAKKKNVLIIEEDSKSACKTFNELCQKNKKVAAIIHSTC